MSTASRGVEPLARNYSRSLGTSARNRLATVAGDARRRLGARLGIVRGAGCRPGDMRLAYGWRRTVLVAALVVVGSALGSRLFLTGLFVALVTGRLVPVVAFNAAVTVASTVLVVAARPPLRRVARRRLVGPLVDRVRRRDDRPL